jgi:hypothetical protein
MRKTALFLVLTLAPLAGANAQNMPLNQFLAKAAALEKKGPLALLSGDMKRLKNEVQSSANELRTERLAALAARKRPAFCPPQKPTGVGVSEILGHFRSIPAAQRARMRTKDAWRSLMVKKYPCPA